MSGIRKYKRIKHWIIKSKRSRDKVTLPECLLVLGAVMTIAGISFSFIYNTYYIDGRPERILNTIIGSFYESKIEAGDTNYKTVSIFCAYLAVIGLVISGISIIAIYLRKRTKRLSAKNVNQ